MPQTNIVDVTTNKVVPIGIEFIDKLPVKNPKVTVEELVIYSGLGEYTSPKSGRKYLVARKWNKSNVAPVGALVRYKYSTGSHGRIYNAYYQWFVVTEGEYDYVLKDTVGLMEKVDVRVKLKNLKPLELPPQNVRDEVEAEIMNKGWQPSEYDPVDILYYFWVRQRVHEPEKVEEEVVSEAVEEEKPVPQVEVKLPEVKPKELEVELVTTPHKPTAVETVQKPELVKVYLLSMRLPSKYLVQKVEVKEGEEVRKWEGVAKEVASRLEGIRREAYDKISRVFAHVEDFGTWIAVTDEAVKEAQKLSEWIREELSKLPISQIKNVNIEKLYSVKAIPIYLEPESAKELLESAIRHLSADVEELENRIKEAEEQQKKSVLKRLEADLQYRKALLDTFRKYLSMLEPEKKEVKVVTTPVQEVEKVGKTEESVKKPVKISA
jgi:predicted DNA-binding antitoxin AbrB/MazE fold protein